MDRAIFWKELFDWIERYFGRNCSDGSSDILEGIVWMDRAVLWKESFGWIERYFGRNCSDGDPLLEFVYLDEILTSLREKNLVSYRYLVLYYVADHNFN
jgi:hypothetical protein